MQQQRFPFPNRRVVALRYAFRREQLLQTAHNLGLGAIHALIQSLKSQIIAVPVDHQPRQLVSFAVNQTVCLRILHYTLPMRFGRGDAAQIERPIDRLHALREQPERYLGRTAIMRRPERRPGWIGHHHSLAASRLAPIQHVAGEDPGMSGCNAVRPFSVNADDMQVLSLVGLEPAKQCSGVVGLCVLGNESQLTGLMQNLLGNAIKYHGAEPVRIAVTAEPRGSGWVVKVQDNGIGIGIAPAYHEQIFGLFKRMHQRSVPGTGIGLAICKKIVDGMGGRIWVESQPSKGSTFCFTAQAAPGKLGPYLSFRLRYSRPHGD